MRTLILTDIHGNLPALRAVLATPEAQSCQRMISLGDPGAAAVWQEADRRWPWRESMSTPEFWHRMEASL